MPRADTPADAGCWMDRTNGWHQHCQIAELALSLGWLTSTDPSIAQIPAATSRGQARTRRAQIGALLAAYQRGDNDARCRTASALSGPVTSREGLCDLATGYLNTLAPDGHYFAWQHGRLVLIEEGRPS